MSSVDTLWVLVSASMVMLMTPGLALFYGGMVRSKNVLNTLAMSLVALAVITVEWVVLGYSLSFGCDLGGIIGDLRHLFLKGVGLSPSPYSPNIPSLCFAVFQMMFAVITPALISGALVERMRFGAYVAFITLWAVLVYNPVCHWVWGKGGWIGGMGALDFAGGTVIHVNAGFAALAAALVLGKRKGYPRDSFIPHNLTLTALGAGLLWFGWFGFNAGSALGMGEKAVEAFVNTHLGAGAATLGWLVVELIHTGRVTVLGILSGMVAGLVAITPAAGFVNPIGAVAIGLSAGAVCYFAVLLKHRLRFYDDSLDVVGIHGVGGFWGSLATGLLAVGVKSRLYQLWVQFFTNIVVVAYTFFLTVAILLLIKAVFGLRVDEDSEVLGLDLSSHGEVGYKL